MGVAHGVTGDDGPDRHHHEEEDGRHLDGGEPELGLSEEFHRDHVDGEDDRQGDRGQHPLRHWLEERPEVQVEGDGSDVGHDGGGPVDEEQPPGDVGPLLTHELTCI